MIKTILEYTDYLFRCDFTDESFDPENHEDHLKASWELFDNYTWSEIYPVWRQYLHTSCTTVEDVINFANLFVYYEALDNPIPDPIEFISYLYYRVDMEKYWDAAGELFDSIATNVLSKSGFVSLMDDPYYSPLKDERIKNGILRWEAQGHSGL